MNKLGKQAAILIMLSVALHISHAQPVFNVYKYYLEKGINYDTINRFDSLHKPYGFWIILNKDRKPKVYGYTDTQIVEEGYYTNGKKTGVWTAYFPEGNKKEEITLLNGKPNGPTTTYYSNGNIKEKRNRDGPKIKGELLMYAENGQLTYKGIYDGAGKSISNERYTDGIKSTETKRVNDSTEVITEFDKTGKIIKTTAEPVVKERSNSKF
ncbi:MAG: hypothetical protein HYU69_17245 [Bacteroidetes bacterium]|nr:hypothetical protein [Bacteroidota bacterium]